MTHGDPSEVKRADPVGRIGTLRASSHAPDTTSYAAYLASPTPPVTCAVTATVPRATAPGPSTVTE